MSSERRLLAGWGRTSPTAAGHRVAAPGDVPALVKAAGPRGLIARGLGRSYGDAAQCAGGDVIELGHTIDELTLDRDTPAVTVSAGVSLDALMRELVPHGFFVPVTPGTRQVSIGGAIAADVHGKDHHVNGSFGRHVRWLELVDGSGSVRRLDPHTTPTEFWATVGGMGLTGVVTRASIALRPVDTSWMVVETRRVPRLDELVATMRATDDDHTYSVAWIDLLARDGALGRSVLTRGEHAGVADLPARQRARPLAFSPRRALRAPTAPDGLVVNPTTVRAFNELWYRRAPRRPRLTAEPLTSFFHPLDGVADWNRLYGRRGLVQYQLVVPHAAEDVLTSVVAEIADSGHASFLAVLKRFGPGNPGPLSFPIAGWTLALDLPARGDLTALLDRLDHEVADAGGRVYLAKDSRARPDTVARMYPRLDEFRQARRSLDPEGVFVSDLARRLSL